MSELKEINVEIWNDDTMDIELNIWQTKGGQIFCAVVVIVDEETRYMPIADKWDNIVNLVEDSNALRYAIDIWDDKEYIAELELKDEAYMMIRARGEHIGGTIREFFDALYCYRRLMAK